MSDESGNIESHTLVLLREIRDRLDRIEDTQAGHSNVRRRLNAARLRRSTAC